MVEGTTREGVDERAEEERSERTYTALGTVLLVILIIIVILLFWRTCGATTESGDRTGSDGIIVDVPPLETVDGAVAVWLRPEGDLATVLERNGLGNSETVSLGDDTYVVTVSGNVDRLIETLKDDPDLLDAGYLYAEE